MSSFMRETISEASLKRMQSYFDEIPAGTNYLDCAGRTPLPAEVGNVGVNALNWKVIS
jgi:hypothetical protein